MKYTADVTDGIGEVKRLYVELVITRPCPDCKEEIEYDLSGHYISYGELSMYFECEDCDIEWEVETEVTAIATIKLKE
jgi:hypothetical protein